MADDAERKRAMTAERKREIELELEKKKEKLAQLRAAKTNRPDATTTSSAASTVTPDQILSAAGIDVQPPAQQQQQQQAAQSTTSNDGSGNISSSSSSISAKRRERRPLTVCHAVVNVEIPPKISEVYSKFCQTEAVVNDDEDSEENHNEQISKKDDAILNKSLNDSKNISRNNNDEEETKTEYSLAEKKSILLSGDFQTFFSRASRIVERALTVDQMFDIMADYTNDQDTDKDRQNAADQLSRIHTFSDDKLTRNRSVTSVQWSPKFPELFLASYNLPSVRSSSDDPDGLVLIWSLAMDTRPEFALTAPSSITTAMFSAFSPHLVIGGSLSGQIFVWDTRDRYTPVMQSPVSSETHTFPVYSMTAVGTQNAHSILSTGTDGKMCVWNLAMMTQPQESLMLYRDDMQLSMTGSGLSPSSSATSALGGGGGSLPSSVGAAADDVKKKELSVTALGFPQGEVNYFVVGSEDGTVCCGSRHAASRGISGVLGCHGGPVTALHFHPSTVDNNNNIDFSDLFLTSSMDWTCKLWSRKTNNLICTFEHASDYIYDVKWSPVHPSLFATADGTGSIVLWDLATNIDAPILSSSVSRGVNNLSWSSDGRKIVGGDAGGNVHLWNVSHDIADPQPDAAKQMHNALRHTGNFVSVI